MVLAHSPILRRKIFPRQRRILHHLPDENQVKIVASRQPEWPLQYERCNEWQAIPLVARNDGRCCYETACQFLSFLLKSL